MLIFDPNGTPVPMGRKLGHGGEADIYEVPDQPLHAAKIYRDPTRYRESKLLAMISSPPHDPTLHMGHASICWPKSLLFNQAGICVGFAMHRVDIATHVPAFKLYNPMDRQNVSLNLTWKYLIRAATNIAAAVEAIHAQGHVIGDFNESNILVANNALVTLVDCDSMQVRDPLQGVCYRCLVGKPEFTPPELQGCEFGKIDRQFMHDNFGLATITFLLLMEGVHPFSGVWKKRGNPPTLEERIRSGFCPYTGHPDITVMPAAPSFQMLPPAIADLFVKCFRDGHTDPSLRPSPSEWKAALTDLEEHLLECRVSNRHLYSDHLASCPWCERKNVLGGIDPFPTEIQTLRPTDESAAAPIYSRVDVQWNPIRSFGRSRWLKWAVAVAVLTVVALVCWNLIREPVRRLWTASNLGSQILPEPELALSPMLLCTGVDSNGVPTGVSDAYTQDELKETGVMAFLTYSGAVAQKTTFRMRWTIEGRTFESPPHVFENEADSIRMNLGKDLAPGTHQIEFLVNGKVERTASMTILGSSNGSASTASAAPSRRRTTRPAVLSHEIIAPAPTVETATPTASPSVDYFPVPFQSQERPETRPESPAQAPVKPTVYQVKHWHRIGTCWGELRLTPQSIEFTSDQHTFKHDINDVQLDEDGILDPNGKAWHFSVQGVAMEQVLSKWKTGGISPGHQSTARHTTAAAEESPKSGGHVYEARHKHTFGSCSGRLTLTADALEFSSKQHYVKSYNSDTQIEGNGIRDRWGEKYTFEIPGQNAGALLRSWKSGELFR